MSFLRRSLPNTQSPESQAPSTVRLHGYWLIVARVVWLAIVVPTLLLYVANIPAYFASLHLLHPPNAPAGTFTGQLTLHDVQTLQMLGLSLNFYAICMILVSLLFQFSYAAVAALLFWRRSDDRVALLVSFALMMFPFGFAYLTLQRLPLEWSWLIQVLVSLSNASIIICAYIFPDGRFVPRWTHWLALAVPSYWIINLLPFSILPRFLSLVLFFGFIGSTVVAQVYRYRYVSTEQQRRQTKWVVYGVSIAAVGDVGVRLLTAFVLLPLSPGSSLPGALQVILVTCSVLVLPLTLGIAILRSRLWDIDVIINRTLVYTVLTATLGLVYAALVIGLQFLLHGLTRGNQLALVGSTLAIAALFQPLRRGIQAYIDRRFYRRKYDVAKTLAAFNATLRNELDLNELSEQLIAVVQETMQPTHVSLWLHPVKPDSKRTTSDLARVSQHGGRSM